MNNEVREVRMLVDVIRAGFRGNCILNDSMRIQKLLKQFVSETQRDRVRVLELKLTLVSPSLAVDIGHFRPTICQAGTSIPQLVL